jgi:hypothetical protein
VKDDRAFWIEVRRGLLLVVRAIENRWNLPRGSDYTIGAQPPPQEVTEREGVRG